jgi:hypothetical protein
MAALFRHIRRREIDGDALRRHCEARGDQGRADRSRDSVTALSPSPTMLKTTLPGRICYLHVDRLCLDSVERDRRNPDHHDASHSASPG